MTCVSPDSLQTFVDNELEAAESNRVAQHLRECPACSREIANVVRLKRATHQAGQRFAVPAALQRKMMARYSSAAPARSWWTKVLVAVPSLVAVMLAVVLTMVLTRDRAGEAAGRELADLHVATTASANPVDVLSSDKHTVKPWFAGKVPFTFNVPELQGSPYELIGGRLAFLNESPAAQLFFKYGNHRVSVFIAQESAMTHRGIRAPNNFTVMHWSTNGLSWFLVTDASPSTMQDLVTRCKEAAATSS
jgi:anti-sigma factor RsiW